MPQVQQEVTILSELVTSLGRRDQVYNQELARRIAAKGDKKAVTELVENLRNKDRNIQGACIKVLYEVGALNPSLIAGHGRELLGLLESKNKRLVWGAMTALDTITLQDPGTAFSGVARVVAASEGDSVIARDHAVGILIKLCSVDRYADEAFPLLMAQLRNCPTNQLPMYAENALSIIKDERKAVFVGALSSRLGEMEKATKRRRVEAVIRKLG